MRGDFGDFANPAFVDPDADFVDPDFVDPSLLDLDLPDVRAADVFARFPSGFTFTLRLGLPDARRVFFTWIRI
jgi:hypothetical protein